MFALYFHKSIALENQNMKFLIRPSLGSGNDYNVYLSVRFFLFSCYCYVFHQYSLNTKLLWISLLSLSTKINASLKCVSKNIMY